MKDHLDLLIELLIDLSQGEPLDDDQYDYYQLRFKTVREKLNDTD